jgi:hypothetical protein
MPDFTLFLNRPVEEKTLLAFFERETGAGWESLQYRNEAAVALLSCLECSDGYPMAVSLAWPAKALLVSVANLASALSKEFGLLVLYEGEESASDTPAEQWFLAEPSLQVPRPVRIRELHDGVCPAET